MTELDRRNNNTEQVKTWLAFILFMKYANILSQRLDVNESLALIQAIIDGYTKSRSRYVKDDMIELSTIFVTGDKNYSRILERYEWAYTRDMYNSNSLNTETFSSVDKESISLWERILFENEEVDWKVVVKLIQKLLQS